MLGFQFNPNSEMKETKKKDFLEPIPEIFQTGDNQEISERDVRGTTEQREKKLPFFYEIKHYFSRTAKSRS